MTDGVSNASPEPQAEGSPAGRRFSWWSVLLVVSLAFNLLVIGGGIARYFFAPPFERMGGGPHMLLLPRSFMGDLGGDRRGEMMKMMQASREQFQQNRQAMRATAEKLAAALVAEPYDETEVRAALDEFAATGVNQINAGTTAALDFIAKLTPEERAKLAERIRERAGRFRK